MNIWGKCLGAVAIGTLLAGSVVPAFANNAVKKEDKMKVENCNATAEEKAGIVKAIEAYLEAGRKGDSKIAQQGFAPAATMSWTENNALKSVPIKDLYAYFDQKPRQVAADIVACNVAGTVAMVRLESQFDDARFTDMFTLVKDGDAWKIVSKVYNVRP